MLAQIAAIAARHGVRIATIAHAGDGNLHPLTDHAAGRRRRAGCRAGGVRGVPRRGDRARRHGDRRARRRHPQARRHAPRARSWVARAAGGRPRTRSTRWRYSIPARDDRRALLCAVRPPGRAGNPARPEERRSVDEFTAPQVTADDHIRGPGRRTGDDPGVRRLRVPVLPWRVPRRAPARRRAPRADPVRLQELPDPAAAPARGAGGRGGGGGRRPGQVLGDA